MRTGRKVTTAARRGLSLTEVIVVLFVFAVLAALILPVMQRARTGPSGNYCQNNLKTLVTAVTNYATKNGGRLPQLYASYPFDPDRSNPKTPDTIRRSWVTALLPELDQGAVFRAISSYDADAGASGKTGNGEDWEWPSLKALQCPKDAGHFNQYGGLSYVANTGYIDSSVWHNSVLSMRHHALAYDWDDGQRQAHFAFDRSLLASHYAERSRDGIRPARNPTGLHRVGRRPVQHDSFHREPAGRKVGSRGESLGNQLRTEGRSIRSGR